MNNVEFINSIKISVEESAVRSVSENLISPPGKSPLEELLNLSKWFNSLSIEDKEMAEKLVREAVHTSVFGFLCVLDGVRAIEDTYEKGKLLLYYEKNNERVLLNDPDEEYLHDLL